MCGRMGASACGLAEGAVSRALREVRLARGILERDPASLSHCVCVTMIVRAMYRTCGMREGARACEFAASRGPRALARQVGERGQRAPLAWGSTAAAPPWRFQHEPCLICGWQDLLSGHSPSATRPGASVEPLYHALKVVLGVALALPMGTTMPYQSESRHDSSCW
jgi:hypothetical protein